MNITTYSFCKYRVLVNFGEECGERTLTGHSYCIAHRVEMLAAYRKRITQKENELAKLRLNYKDLLAEGQAR